MQLKCTTYRVNKPTTLWSKINKITTYRIKYISYKLTIFQKTNLKVKISMKFDSRVTWANLIRSGGRVCLRKITQLSRFIDEKQTKSILNKKFVQISLCLRLRKKRVQFLIREERRVSNLQELQVHLEANLSTLAEHIFQTFRN